MHRTLQIAAALLAVTASAAAQGVPPAPAQPPADTSSIILAPRPAAAALTPSQVPSSADHAVSPAIAAEIASEMAGYRPDVYAAKSENSNADLREVDKPRNQIPRLPMVTMQKYVVREARMPVFRTRDLYTKAGLIALSFKEHPGLRIGNFFNLNADIAYETIIEEQLAADREDIINLTFAMAAGGDTQETGVMQQALIDDGFNRESPVGK